MTGSQNFEFLIQERSRSVKSLFACQQVSTKNFAIDNGATHYDTATWLNSACLSYQYRIGGRYFPAAPVELAVQGTPMSNGGAEAYAELSKALNTVGDYRLSSTASALTWAIPVTSAAVVPGLSDRDYQFAVIDYGAVGEPLMLTTYETTGNPGFCGGVPSANFCMAINLETSNGDEVAGLNAEEQSDIALKCSYYAPQGAQTGTQMNIFVYFDSMIILRENNVIEFVQ